MKIMRRVLPAIGTAVLFVGVALSGEAAENLTIGYFPAPGMIVVPSKEGDSPQGAIVEYYEAYAQELGLDLTWQGPLPFPRLMKLLRHGKIDSAFLLSKSPEREELLHFSRWPFLVNDSYFIAPKALRLGNGGRIHSVVDMLPFVVGKGDLLIGLPYHVRPPPFISENLAQFNTYVFQNLENMLTTEQSVLLLTKRRVAGIAMGSEKRARLITQSLPDYEVLTLPIQEELYIVFSRVTKNPSFIQRWDQASQKLNLKFEEILKKYSSQ